MSTSGQPRRCRTEESPMADEAGPPDPEQRRGITRRQAIIGGGAAAVAVGGGTAAIIVATGDDEGEDYPRSRIASVSELERDKPVNFEYPLEGQQSVLLDMGEEVP